MISRGIEVNWFSQIHLILELKFRDDSIVVLAIFLSNFSFCFIVIDFVNCYGPLKFLQRHSSKKNLSIIYEPVS